MPSLPATWSRPASSLSNLACIGHVDTLLTPDMRDHATGKLLVNLTGRSGSLLFCAVGGFKSPQFFHTLLAQHDSLPSAAWSMESVRKDLSASPPLCVVIASGGV